MNMVNVGEGWASTKGVGWFWTRPWNGNGMKRIRISFWPPRAPLLSQIFGLFFRSVQPVLCTFFCLLCETSQLNKNKTKWMEKKAKDESARDMYVSFYSFDLVPFCLSQLGASLHRQCLSLFSTFSTLSGGHKEPKIKYFRLLHIAASGRANRFCYCFCCSIPIHRRCCCCCSFCLCCLLECICTDGRTDTHTYAGV